MKKLLSIMPVVFLLFLVGCNNKTSAVINVNIDSIPAREVVCLGSIKLEKGGELNYNVSAKSGTNLFIALSKEDNLSTSDGVLWSYYNSSILPSSVNQKHSVDESGTFYIYAGGEDSSLKNITGTVSFSK